MKPWRRVLLIAVCLVLGFSPVTQAQFFDRDDVFSQGEIDYDKVFKEGLSRGGKKLRLNGKKIGDKGLALLLEKDFLKKVTDLDLRYNEISERGAAVMAASPALVNLRELELRHNYLLDKGAKALAASENMPQLQELGLSFNEIRDQGALAFAESKNFPKLKKLDLRGNFLADTTKDTLQKKLAHLKTLKLF
ncbi:hypothetical protein [Nitrospina watsonii]|uniref:Uncharacterized protein n=1 Tax=Nitrospina watsonii TaxID=1323948 RepID=A0ABM9HF89_9BACT|nr:hypothetical protein [Nitrospina watsonii]CAI2718896.1 conserved exported protein of unknown function [Nitrospina watsonii]